MSDDKLKLPTTLGKPFRLNTDSPSQDGAHTETSKTQMASSDTIAKVEIARLRVAQEAISATKTFFCVLKSHNDLQATRAEWEGKVTAAEIAVKKAQVDLETAQENNKTRMEKLEQSREAQTRILSLFDEVMKQVTDADLSEEVRKEARQYLLHLSSHIVQLKK